MDTKPAQRTATADKDPAAAMAIASQTRVVQAGETAISVANVYGSSQSQSSRLGRLDVERLSEIDRFNRAGFARYLLEVIDAIDVDVRAQPEDNHGAVVGLAGPWGSGKSWILEHARLAAQERPGDLLWITFSAWQLSGSDALIAAMLSQLSAQVREQPWLSATDAGHAVELAEAMLALSQISAMVMKAASIPLAMSGHHELAIEVGGAGAALHEATKTTEEGAKSLLSWFKGRAGRSEAAKGKPTEPKSLKGAREEVIKSLQKLGRKVVIVIDDLDRMTPREIADIVQMVKAVADFPQVVYMLAYDPGVVAKALQKALDVEDGALFLEKIIQINVPVPPTSVHTMAQVVEARAKEAFAHAEWRLDGAEAADVRAALPLAAALLDHPREIQRLQLHLKIAARALNEDVCAADLLLIEALRLKAPDVVTWLDQHRHELLDPSYLVADDLHLAKGSLPTPGERARGSNQQPTDFPELWALASARGAAQGQRIRKALGFVFDRIDERSKHLRAPLEGSRLQSLPNWLRWQGFLAHDPWLRNAVLKELVREPAKVKSSPFWASADDFQEFIVLAAKFINGPDLDSVGFVALVAETAQKFGGMHALAGPDLGALSVMSYERVLKTSTTEEFLPALRAMVDFEQFFEAAEQLRCGTTNKVPIDRMPEAKALAERCIEGGLRWLQDGQGAIRDGHAPTEMAWRLRRLGAEPSELRKLLEALFDSEPEQMLLACFRGLDAEGLTSLWDAHDEWLPRPTFLVGLMAREPLYAQEPLTQQQCALWQRLSKTAAGEAGELADAAGHADSA